MLTPKRAIAILKAVGAKDPVGRGRAHAKYPTVQRHLLLTGMWRAVLPDDTRWTADGKDPVAQAVSAALAAGVRQDDLTRIARQAQIDLLYEVCQLLDRSDHGIEDLQGKIEDNVEWRVCEYDGEREVVGRPMQDLHSDVMSYDPTGREGVPAQRRRARKK